MWLAMGSLTSVLSLAENNGVSQSRAARSNVDRSSTSEIERWKVVKPAIGVPSPASNWAVNNGAPAESKN